MNLTIWFAKTKLTEPFTNPPDLFHSPTKNNLFLRGIQNYTLFVYYLYTDIIWIQKSRNGMDYDTSWCFCVLVEAQAKVPNRQLLRFHAEKEKQLEQFFKMSHFVLYKSYRFGTTRGWVNEKNNFVLKSQVTVIFDTQMWPKDMTTEISNPNIRLCISCSLLSKV